MVKREPISKSCLAFSFDRLYELRVLIRLIEFYVVESQKKYLAGISKQIGKPITAVS